MTAQMPLTRRQMLRMSAGSLLAAGVWPGAMYGDSPSGEFSFIAVNDLHYFDKRCGPWFDKTVQQMNGHKEKPDFCLIVGDLAENGKAEQFGPLRDILRTLKIPYRVVIGNHDYRTQQDRKAFEGLFPKSLNYHFAHAGWQFIGLDSSDGQKAQVAVQAPTLRWLDDTLPKLDKRRPTVVFTHMPFGSWVIYRASNADQVLDRFKEFNLVAVYNGHFHSLTQRQRGQTALTTNRCCSFFKKNHDGTKEKGYFLCRAKDGKIERQFVEVKALPKSA
jgi:3',5'-cyclic AMP phosphodiesterase CpdA